MPYHSSDEEMNTTTGDGDGSTTTEKTTTTTKPSRRGRRPVGGRRTRRRGDDADSSDDDNNNNEEVDLDRLKKSSDNVDTEMMVDDNDNDKSKDQDQDQQDQDPEQMIPPPQQQDDSSFTGQTQTQTQTQGGGGGGGQSQATMGTTATQGTTSTQIPHGLIIGDADINTLRILLSTDNHLGYAEDDNIRGNDSFAALEEVLFLAKEYRCDMVLLAGDLFHHNRPTRRTLYKTMDIFKRYCMGPGAIQVQIVSGSAEDAAATATATTTTATATTATAARGGATNNNNNNNNNSNSPFVRGYVNYEDENYSVDLPVFSIHGNHDDPSRDGGNSELYAALDLLDVSNLVNYFGKQQDAKDIRVDPILLRKGTTQVALYGLGSMRDERLNRMWRGEHLTFSRPAEDPNVTNNNGGDDDDPTQQWFNIFALHQNRDRGRGAKNCIKEDMIPDWMDFICWGHEHECDIEVTESVVGTFRISQPGSSVATSLVEGESMRKKIGILDIREGQFRLTAIPLTQVRSFVLGTVRLADVPRLDPDDPKVDTKVSKLLEEKVRVLIHDAREKRRELLVDAEDGGNVLAKYYNNASNDDSVDGMAGMPLKHTLHKEDEVLVRLKVDHTGFAAVNNQRFGAKFVGESANPSDILLFTRKRSESKSQAKSTKEVKPIEPGDVEEMDIEELIVEQFEVSNTKLELFDDKKISLALDAYVGKQEARAINEALEKLLGKQQNKLIKSGAETAAEGLGKGANTEDADEPDTGKKKKEKKTKRTKSEDYDDEEEDAEQSFEDDDIMEEDPPPKSRSTKKGTQSSTSSRKRKDSSYYEEEEGDDDESAEDVVDTPKSKSRSTKSRAGGAKGRKTAAKRTEESEDDDSDIQVVDPPARNRGAKKRTTKKPVNYSMNESDDDDDDEIIVVDDSDDSPPPKKKSGRGKAAAAAKKKTKKSSASTNKRGRDSTESNLAQSQLSFTSTKRKEPKNTKRKATTRKRNNVDSDDDDNFQPAGRSYEDDDDDWGTAQSNTASTF